MPDSLADQLRKTSVAAVDPPTGRNPIRLVLELSRVKLVKFLKDSPLQQVRVNLSDSVDSVRANN